MSLVSGSCSHVVTTRNHAESASMQGLAAPYVSGIKEKCGNKKAPPERGLLGRQRAGNHPSPHSVKKLEDEANRVFADIHGALAGPDEITDAHFILYPYVFNAEQGPEKRFTLNHDIPLA